MTYDDLMALIESSRKEDWAHDDDWGEVWTYKNDLNVRIEHVKQGGAGEQVEALDGEEVHEEWALTLTETHDENPFKKFYAVLYGSSFVELFMGLIVGHGRGWVPLPKTKDDLSITVRQYKLGKIVESHSGATNSLDFFLERANIGVREGN